MALVHPILVFMFQNAKIVDEKLGYSGLRLELGCHQT